MHASVLAWFATIPAGVVAGRRVLEVGSYNVNGTVRPIVEAHGLASYVGVDQTAGPGVDRVVPCAELVDAYGADPFDVVIATELLEHVQEWRSSVAALVDVLAPGGSLLVTTRSPGFPYHPFPVDMWRYTVEAMRRIIVACGLQLVDLVPDPDPKAPGVFVHAAKPHAWTAPWAARPVDVVFRGIPVQAVTAP